MTLSKFRTATKNANRHTVRGLKALQDSMRAVGYTEPMVAAADGEMLSGSARLETVADVFGVEIEPVVVHTRGQQPIIHVRDDIPNAHTVEAQRIALGANRIAFLDWDPDVSIIANMSPDAIGDLYTPAELSDLGQMWADEQGEGANEEQQQEDEEGQEPSSGELLSLVNVTIAEPTHKVEHGETWHVGKHILVVADVLVNWPIWKKYLEGDGLIFCPYPGPFVPLTLRAESGRLLMVQPSKYIAGHILDCYAEIHGEKVVRRA